MSVTDNIGESCVILERLIALWSAFPPSHLFHIRRLKQAACLFDTNGFLCR